MSIHRRIALTAAVLSCWECLHSRTAADVPAALQKEIDAAAAKYADALKAADDKLSKAFDDETALLRKQGGLKAEERQQLIEAVTAEKAAWEKSGSLPLSPRMRTAAIIYVKSTQEARKAPAAAYDKVIEHLTKTKDDAGAAEKVGEKKKILAPRVVARWNCVGVTWKGRMTYVLYSDGTARVENEPQIATWTLGKDTLVIKNPHAKGPPGGWIETCVVEPSGLEMLATNQQGGKWKATRSDSAK